MVLDVVILAGLVIYPTMKAVMCFKKYLKKKNQFYALQSPSSVREVQQIPMISKMKDQVSQKGIFLFFRNNFIHIKNNKKN